MRRQRKRRERLRQERGPRPTMQSLREQIGGLRTVNAALHGRLAEARQEIEKLRQRAAKQTHT